MYLVLRHLDIAVETRSADIGIPSDMMTTKFRRSSVNASSQGRGAYGFSHSADRLISRASIQRKVDVRMNSECYSK